MARTVGVGPRLERLSVPPPPELAPVWAQIEHDMGILAPPLVLHSPVPRLLAAAWAAFRETMMVEAGLPRAVKEAMAIGVSEANRCPYCIDAHVIGLRAAGGGAVERALGEGGADLDPALRERFEWAAASGRAGAAGPPPFAPGELAQGMGAVVAFHYINRLVTVLLPEQLLPVRDGWLRRPLVALAGARFSGRARASRPPGAGLELVPADLVAGPGPDWAAGNPEVARSFAALETAVGEAVEGLLSDAARARATARIAAWDGESPPFGTEWLEPDLAGLTPADRAALHLAVLTALAPHRAGDEPIAEFRRHHPGDPALVGLLAWGAYRAAERVATWLRR
jgi:AhpD family alkylhydroperoxidase